jgi:hypothetical protein
MSRAGGAHPSEGDGYADLSPINFLFRAAGVFPDRQAIGEPRRDPRKDRSGFVVNFLLVRS